MSNVLGFILGGALIVVLIFIHSFLATYAEFKEAKEETIKQDKKEFGYCCGLEDGVCTFQPKLDKLNKEDPHHKK
jgi:hypothetical protein